MYLDPISDLILRIKNAAKNHSSSVVVKSSKLITNILTIFKQEGYITDFSVKDIGNNKKETKVILKYKNKKSSITGLKQISKPGLKIYVGAKSIPKVLNGLGVGIVSTNLGLMTDKKARSQNLGGELLAYIW